MNPHSLPRLVREAEHQELDDFLYQLLIAQLKEADLLTPQSLKAYEPEHEYFKKWLNQTIAFPHSLPDSHVPEGKRSFD